MHDRAILIVSFGTSCDDARERAIAAVERAVREAFPRMTCRTAFTSGMIRRKLAERGTLIPGVTEALAALRGEGVRRVLVLPTHLIYGEEYDKLCVEAHAMRGAFDDITIAKPLLANYDDVRAVLAAIDCGVPRRDGEALVLMGHGTAHHSNYIYAAMNDYVRDIGPDGCYIGTVEAYPALDSVLARLAKDGRRSAVLTPLMLVAGEHAQNDMAGDEDDSWMSRLRAAGIETRAVVRGLGEYEAVRALYCEHARQALADA